MIKPWVIILHFGDIHSTRTCLSSIRQPNSTVVVVDNSSDPRVNRQLHDRFPEVTIIGNRENLGYAGGMNIGLKYAFERNASAVILLNNDTVVDKGAIVQLMHATERESFGIASPKIYFTKGHEYHKNRYSSDELGTVIWYGGGTIDWKNMYASHLGVDEVDHGQYNKQCDTDFASGCCMVVSRRAYDRVGPMSEQYFLYYEDVDYSMRIKKAGLDVEYLPSVKIWHTNAASSGKPGSSLHVYYQTRNRLIFGMRFASLRTKKSLLMEGFRMLSHGSIQAQAVRDFMMFRWGRKSI